MAYNGYIEVNQLDLVIKGLIGWSDGQKVGWYDGWMVGWYEGWMVGCLMAG